VIIITESHEEDNGRLMKVINRHMSRDGRKFKVVHSQELTLLSVPITKETVELYKDDPEMIWHDKELLAAYELLKDILE
jgi:hypothetical protein